MHNDHRVSGGDMSGFIAQRQPDGAGSAEGSAVSDYQSYIQSRSSDQSGLSANLLDEGNEQTSQTCLTSVACKIATRAGLPILLLALFTYFPVSVFLVSNGAADWAVLFGNNSIEVDEQLRLFMLDAFTLTLTGFLMNVGYIISFAFTAAFQIMNCVKMVINFVKHPRLVLSLFALPFFLVGPNGGLTMVNQLRGGFLTAYATETDFPAAVTIPFMFFALVVPAVGNLGFFVNNLRGLRSIVDFFRLLKGRGCYQQLVTAFPSLKQQAGSGGRLVAVADQPKVGPSVAKFVTFWLLLFGSTVYPIWEAYSVIGVVTWLNLTEEWLNNDYSLLIGPQNLTNSTNPTNSTNMTALWDDNYPVWFVDVNETEAGAGLEFLASWNALIHVAIYAYQTGAFCFALADSGCPTAKVSMAMFALVAGTIFAQSVPGIGQIGLSAVGWWFMAANSVNYVMKVNDAAGPTVRKSASRPCRRPRCSVLSRTSAAGNELLRADGSMVRVYNEF